MARYRAALVGTFVKRNLVPAEALQPLLRYRGRSGRGAFGIAVVAKTRAAAPRLHTFELRAREFGLGAGTLVVEAPLDRTAFRMASAALLQQHADRTQRVEQAVHRFVRMLFAHHRVDTRAVKRRVGTRRVDNRRHRRQTHEIVRAGSRLRLVRRKFDCGACG